MRTITENFNIILDRQKSIGYDYRILLNPPADASDIQKTEDKLRRSFSDELKELYLLANGITSKPHTANLFGLFPAFDFMNLDNAVHTYLSFESDFTLVAPAYGEIFTVCNYDYTQIFTPQRNMFPIFDDECGDYYWVDMNENTQHRGQILFTFKGDGSEYEFNSLTSLFQTIAECYENNVFLLEDSVNLDTGFKQLIQNDEKWAMTCKKNNPGMNIWDDYLNSK